jgi:hypothetical protein
VLMVCGFLFFSPLPLFPSSLFLYLFLSPGSSPFYLYHLSVTPILSYCSIIIVTLLLLSFAPIILSSSNTPFLSSLFSNLSPAPCLFSRSACQPPPLPWMNKLFVVPVSLFSNACARSGGRS